MTEEILTHRPTRTATKYVSEAFSFLNSEDVDTTDDDIAHKFNDNLQLAEEGKYLETNGYVNGKESDHDVKKDAKAEYRIITSVDDSEPLVNGETSTDCKAKLLEHNNTSRNYDTEFSIVTYVVSGDKGVHDKEKEQNKIDTFNGELIEINPVYEVTDVIEEVGVGNNLENSNNVEEVVYNGIVSHENKKSENETIETKNNAIERKSVDNTENSSVFNGMDVIPDSINGNAGERSSVIVDGELVELRKSPGEIRPRQSRQPTWKRNQHFVSEAFGFLKEIDIEDGDDSRDSAIVSDLSFEKCNLCGQLLNSGFEASENCEGQSYCRQCNAKQRDSEAVNNETDEIGELPNCKPGITRRRKAGQQSGSGDDDGNSSDEDKGNLLRSVSINFGL